MKKRILFIALMIVFGTTSILANSVEGVNEKVLTSFQKEFSGAKEVKWQKGDQYVKATFLMNDKVFFAYYSEDGEKIALVRNLTSFELPMSLQDELKESFGQYWITDLFELNGREDSAYFITIENADVKITLKSLGMSGWATYKKADKK